MGKRATRGLFFLATAAAVVWLTAPSGRNLGKQSDGCVALAPAPAAAAAAADVLIRLINH